MLFSFKIGSTEPTCTGLQTSHKNMQCAKLPEINIVDYVIVRCANQTAVEVQRDAATSSNTNDSTSMKSNGVQKGSMFATINSSVILHFKLIYHLRN